MKTNKLELPALIVVVNNSLSQFFKDDFLDQTAKIPDTLQLELQKSCYCSYTLQIFSQLQQFLQQFYIQTTIFFWKKYCEILCSVQGP